MKSDSDDSSEEESEKEEEKVVTVRDSHTDRHSRINLD